MKKLLAFALLLAASVPASAANNYGAIVAGGSTVTFCAKDTGGGILSVCHVITDSTGTPFGTYANPFYFGNTAFGLAAGSNAIGTVGVTAAPNPADVVTTPTLNTGTAGTYAEFPVAGASDVALEITNLPAGAAVTFYKRVGSTLYTSSPLLVGTGGNYTATGSANGVYQFVGGGAQYIRVVVSTAATGTANLTWAATAGLREVTAKFSAIVTGGATPYQLISTASTNSTLIAAGPHTLYGASALSLTATAGFVHFYDSATAPANCGASATSVQTLPAIGSATQLGGVVSPAPPMGIAFVNGIAMCVTGAAAANDNSAAVAGIVVNASFK